MTLTQRLITTLRGQIESGELSPGTTLPSMRDLALQHGVSEITVRAAMRELRSHGLIESRPRIGTVVSASRPRSAPSKPFALVMPALRDPFFARIAHGAQTECVRQNVRLLTPITGGNVELEASELEALATQASGVAVFPVATNLAPYETLRRRGVPVVFVDRPVKGVDAPLVSMNNVRAGQLAGEYLAQLERPVYAMCNPPEVLQPVRDRLDGVAAALRAAGQPFDDSRVFVRYGGEDAIGIEMMRAILATNPRLPIAVLAINDAVARGAYATLREAKLRIPHDCAIVGFGDAIAVSLDPPLSSVWLDEEGLGRVALSSLISLARGEAVPPLQLLEPHFISRGSGQNAEFCRVSALLGDAPANHWNVLQPA